MPVPTPFHTRTSELCTSLRWKEWAGCYAVSSYDTHADREYFAFRHAAGLLDVSPLFKYELRGKDAGALLARVWTKDITKIKPGRVTYGCWTDEEGKVLDDGTVTCLDDGHYRMTSADPSLAWLERNAVGFDVEIADTSRTTAAVALQGPNARDVLCAACDDDGALAGLKFFRHARATLDGVAVEVTRTGYTGDLGYEVWCDANDALKVWDGLMGAGRPYAIHVAGLDALDVTRIEAGFILLGVDYRSARRCFTDEQKSSPYEIGLGWAVKLERDFFIGQAALQSERRTNGSKWAVVGVEIDWLELEQLYDRFDLPLELPNAAYRTSVPLYHDTQQVGYISSGVWSPTLKRNLGIATVQAEAAALGTRLSVEQTVEFQRHRVTATVVDKPFFDPERKRSVPETATAR